MLDATMKQQLGTYLELLRNPIELTVSTDNSASTRASTASQPNCRAKL